MSLTADPQATVAAEQARVLVEARRAGLALPRFPGALPKTLAQAYAIQDAAIALWPDAVAGWKVGRVPDSLQAALGEERVAGAVFARRVWRAGPGREVAFPVFAGGFAAVEAEVVAVVGLDAPVDYADFSDDEALALIGAMHIGVETAGSPLADINALGPTAVASDFGNNAGVILGPEIANWRDGLAALTAETFIDGERVGRGGLSALPGGPVASVRFIAGHCARHGRPLRAGQLISTGALTGIHVVVPGQSARVSFGAAGEILCRAVPAQAD